MNNLCIQAEKFLPSGEVKGWFWGLWRWHSVATWVAVTNGWCQASVGHHQKITRNVKTNLEKNICFEFFEYLLLLNIYCRIQYIFFDFKILRSYIQKLQNIIRSCWSILPIILNLYYFVFNKVLSWDWISIICSVHWIRHRENQTFSKSFNICKKKCFPGKACS